MSKTTITTSSLVKRSVTRTRVGRCRQAGRGRQEKWRRRGRRKKKEEVCNFLESFYLFTCAVWVVGWLVGCVGQQGHIVLSFQTFCADRWVREGGREGGEDPAALLSCSCVEFLITNVTIQGSHFFRSTVSLLLRSWSEWMLWCARG